MSRAIEDGSLSDYTLTLEHPTGSSVVRVGQGVLGRPHSTLTTWLADRTVFVVTSPRVWNLHGDRVLPTVGAASRVHRLEVAEGEAAKSLAHAERLWDQMLESEGKRDSRIVAFGGGSVGDLAGFVAGSFLRGIEYAQIPTTLLAQVDASIGGKTGVNLPTAKNSIGLFHHPSWVVTDPVVLETLPPEELRSGLLEVVKAGIALDSHLFDHVEDNLDRLLGGDLESLTPVIAEAIAAKIAVVEKDPSEQGARRLLNLGHTLGHALEANLGYTGLRHGEAVGYGMLFAVRLARSRGLAEIDAKRIEQVIGRFELPVLPPLRIEDLMNSIRVDKKQRESFMSWVLPTAIGTGEIFDDLTEAEVGDKLHRYLVEASV